MAKGTVIFDLDGTLTYTLDDLAASTNHALAAMGYDTRNLDEIRDFVGDGVENLVRRAMPLGSAPDQVARCLSLFKAHYAVHCQDTTRLYDGVGELLDELQARGKRVAIVSNKLQSGVDALVRLFFAGRVQAAIGERDGMARKPAPDMVREAMRQLAAEPGDCLYVGDSDVDVATARNSGLPCVAVLWGFRSREVLAAAGAKEFITEPLQLLRYLE